MNVSLDFRPSRWIPLLLLLALAGVPTVAAGMEQPFWTAFFARILIYAIAASALNLALGYGGLVSFGHALFLGVGAYAVGLSAFHGLGSGWLHLGFALAAAALVGLVVGAISLRTSGMAFIMITLAFAQMGYFLLVSLKQYGGDDGLPVSATSRFGALDLGSTATVYYAAWLVLVAVLWWMARLRLAPFGMASARGTTERPAHRCHRPAVASAATGGIRAVGDGLYAGRCAAGQPERLRVAQHPGLDRLRRADCDGGARRHRDGLRAAAGCAHLSGAGRGAQGLHGALDGGIRAPHRAGRLVWSAWHRGLAGSA
jgi:hypothetical protein